ncbi:MAG: hypothetical protein AAGJ46_13905, partial [Planctomycetota bacterium]
AERDLAAEPNASGNVAPVRTLYQVRLTLVDASAELPLGARATVKVSVAPQTPAQRLVRWAYAKFRLAPPSAAR